MSAALQLSPEPVSESIVAATEHAEVISDLFRDFQVALPADSIVRRDEPLARRTTLRVGGPADLFVEPSSENALASVLELCQLRGVSFLLLGRGSNLLVRDGGYRGVVIHLGHANFSKLETDEDRVRAGAGVRLKDLAHFARRAGLEGFEFLEGIPGNAGGALRMNAGAMGTATFEIVERVRFMSRAGEVSELPVAEIPVEYRCCPLLKSHIALGAVLRGRPADETAVRTRMEGFSDHRWKTQPAQSSAGCMFKNPETAPAGRLVDELGLKGTRVGAAMVSEVHANFIVNLGGATARDVLSLIELVRLRVREARGIDLHTEVEIVGEDPG
jgi:UDP-N-acetylenolpyruvoylglucosamine reductase